VEFLDYNYLVVSPEGQLSFMGADISVQHCVTAAPIYGRRERRLRNKVK
jgi:hypothetical protein